MTLYQAFTEWAAIPKNKAMAARNRSALNSILLKDLGQKDVRELTAFVVRKHMASITDSCDEIKMRKVRSASILVEVLKYAAGKNICVMPDFNYSIASTKDSGEDSGNAVPDPPKPASVVSADIQRETTDVDAQSQSRNGFGMFVKGCEPWNKGKHPGVFGGRPKVPVVQLHPDTLQVVARFECMAYAEREAKVSNIFRSLKDHKLSGGYYWCREGEENDFKPDYKAGPHQRHGAKKNESSMGTRKPAGKSASGEEKCYTISLSSFSDEQLKDELVLRGWSGTLYKRLIL